MYIQVAGKTVTVSLVDKCQTEVLKVPSSNPANIIPKYLYSRKAARTCMELAGGNARGALRLFKQRHPDKFGRTTWPSEFFFRAIGRKDIEKDSLEDQV